MRELVAHLQQPLDPFLVADGHLLHELLREHPPYSGCCHVPRSLSLQWTGPPNLSRPAVHVSNKPTLP